MRGRTGAVLLAGTAVAALALGAAPSALGAARSAASAVRTWTLRPGGAVTAKAAGTKVTDTTSNVTVKCTSSSLSGTLTSGSGLPGAGVGSITAAAYHCPSPLTFIHVTARNLPWQLNLTSYDPGTGVSHGTISHLRLTFETIACSAVINGNGGPADGVVAVTYSNKTGTLRILPTGGNLHWVHVRGCHTLFTDGDAAALSVGYAVSPQQTITSP